MVADYLAGIVVLFAIGVKYLACMAADLIAIILGAFLALTDAGVSTFVLKAFVALIVVLAIITATVATMQPNFARLHVKHDYMQRLVVLEEQPIDLVADLGR
jgi:hypothetical protein